MPTLLSRNDSFDKLPKTIELKGPPLRAKNHVSFFKKKHKQTFTKNNRIFAIEKRKFTNVISLIKDAIKKSNIKDNVSKIKVN